MNYGAFSMNEWVYPDSNVANGKKTVDVTVPRNSYACAQILINRTEEAFGVTLTVSGLDTVGAVYSLIPVYAEKNTGERGFTVAQGTEVPYACRQAPFWVYDAMELLNGPVSPDENGTAALYIRICTKNVSAGTYSGILSIDDCKIPVSVKVSSVAVPEKETLRLTNWFSLSNMAKYHGIKSWSEEHWKMMEVYGRKMRECRQTDFMIKCELAVPSKNADGTYTFDFSHTKSFIELFLSMGFSHIEGNTMIHREEWSLPTFVINIDGKNLPALSDESYAYMQGYFTGFYRLLKENGWLSITCQHVADEPHKDCADEYRILSGIVRGFMPGVRIIEAVDIPELNGAVDVWVPTNRGYTEHADAYESKRRFGDRIWFYTCCCPGGYYLNRLLDNELLRTRYLHWANYVFDMEGYLHWGLNHYECTDDPFCGHAGSIETLSVTALPCGDSHILYPRGKDLLGSVRYEMMRAGCEDYELLKLARKKGKSAADAIAGECVRSFTDYTAEVNVFDGAYGKLLAVLER